MYRDLWRKFGTKVLIVLCSVLLLGGIAIAAPRLQAADGDSQEQDAAADGTGDGLAAQNAEPAAYDGRAAYKLTEITGGAFEVAGDATFTYAIDTSKILAADTDGDLVVKLTDHVGATNLPKLSQVTYDGKTLDQYGTSAKPWYEISASKNGNCTEAGSASAVVTATEFNETFETGLSTTVTYTISRSSTAGNDFKVVLGTQDVTTSSENYLYISDVSTFSLNNVCATFKAPIEGTTYTIQPCNSDLTITQTPTEVSSAKNRFEYKVGFNNFGSNTSMKEASNYFDQRQSVSNLIVYVKASGSEDLTQVEQYIFTLDDKDDTDGFESRLVVKDASGNTIPSSGSDATVKVELEYNESSKPYIKLSGIETAAVYGDSKTIEFKGVAGIESLHFKDYKSHFAYDTGKTDGTGYIQKPSSLYYTSNSGKEVELTEGTDYTLGTLSYVYRENGTTVVDEGNTKGATAGRFRLQVIGKGSYANSSWEVDYYVYRNLSDAKVAFVNLPTGGFVYDGTNKILPEHVQVYFDNDSSHPLTYDSDYTLSFSNYWRSYTNDQSKDENQETANKYAGDVTVTVTGTGGGSDSTEQSGYYGSIATDGVDGHTQPCTIKPITIDSTWMLTLDTKQDDSTTSPKYRFQYTGEALINQTGSKLTRSFIKRKSETSDSGVKITDLVAGTDYTVQLSRKNESGNWITVDNATEVGIYQVKYVFNQNYDGNLTAEFEIYTYPIDKCTITLGECETCGATGEENHIYNGKEHHPEVIIKGEKGETMPEDAYQIEYSANCTDATRKSGSKATVTVTDEAGSSKTIEFTIDPMPLAADSSLAGDFSVRLNTADGYTPDEAPADGTREHAYVGKYKLPGLPTVQFTYQADGSDTGREELEVLKKQELQQGADFEIVTLTNQDQGKAISEDSIPLSGVYPNTTDQYYYTIKGIGNYTGTASTDVFKLKAKNISDTSITAIEQVDYDFIKALAADLSDYSSLYAKANTEGAEWVKDTEFQTKQGADTVLQGAESGADYKITGYENSVAQDGTIVLKLEGTGCYTGETSLSLNVGTNINGAILYENRTYITYENDVRTLKQSYARLGDGYNMIFLSDEPNAATGIKLEYQRGTKTEFLSSATYTPVGGGSDVIQQYKVEWGSITYPENPSDTVWATMKLIGINGYYGSMTVTFKVENRDLNDYTVEVHYRYKEEGGTTQEITEPGTYYYTGFEIEPVVLYVKLYDKEDTTAEPIILKSIVDDPDYGNFKVEYRRNIEANEGDKQSPAQVIITGLNGYSGEYIQDFTIKKRPLNKEGTEENGTWIIPTNFTGVDGKTGEYKYAPSTKDEETGLWSTGVCPQIGLQFQYDDNSAHLLDLKRNTDYRIEYQNNTAVGEATADPASSRPTMVITAVENSNFTGSFKLYFTIKAVYLAEDCYIRFANDHLEYTGEKLHPEVTVYQKNEGENDTDPTDDLLIDNTNGSQYTIVWETGTDNVFVTLNQSSAPVVTVKQAGGNYLGEISKQFTIVGNLDLQAKSNVTSTSALVCTNNIVPYRTTLGTDTTLFPDGSSRFTFSQTTGTYGSKDRNMYEGTDYKITSGIPTTIGSHKITISGTYDQLNPDKEYYFTKSRQVDIVIQGDLGASYTECTVKNAIAYEAGITREAFEKKLAGSITIKSGGKTLVYGKDYQFDPEETLNTDLGEYTITVIPTAAANEDADGETDKGYLIGQLQVTYEVKESIENGALYYKGENVSDISDWRFEYAHGDPVISEEYVQVMINGDTLSENNYDVVIENAVDVGVGTLKVTAKGSSYTGTLSKNFTIDPYDLYKAYMSEPKKLTISYKNGTPNVTYTGDEVMPELDKLVITKDTGGKKELTPVGGENAEYEIIAGSKEGRDHVNYTSPDTAEENKPTFIIRSVTPNYTTSQPLEFTYSILQKNIADTDVVFDDLGPFQYQNGKDITPVPTATYNSRSLTGVLYGTEVADGDYTKHFTYQYGSDVKNVGQKSIRVVGIGNFYGSRDVNYEVTKYDLSSAELVLTSDETPVYDGQEQRIPFEIRASGDVIAVFNGTSISSNYLRPDPVVTFIDAVNAGKNTATVKVEVADGDVNYEGSLVKVFSIDPASLADSVRFMYYPVGGTEAQNLASYELNLPFSKGNTVMPLYGTEKELQEGELGVYYSDADSRLNNELVLPSDYDAEYMYVEPDTDDEEVREEYRNPDPALSYAGKVKVTITGKGNFKDSAVYWYYIGEDISGSSDCSLKPTTTVYNAQVQKPKVTVEGVSEGQYKVVYYKHSVGDAYRMTGDDQFVDADTYYIRIEGDPTEGTYASSPQQLVYTITARPFSSSLLIDGFKKEYAYTGNLICPVGISVTDYIDDVKYKLTENEDYTLTYANNLNAGAATITVTGQNNFRGIATARFTIISSTISNGNMSDSGGNVSTGAGHISGATEVTSEDVTLSLDTADAMYYTGNALYPGVSISGMTENQDYTVTYSNNINVGTGTVTITGIGNNSGIITKNFRIIAQLSKCTIAAIPNQEYTGYAITPPVTVMCGNVTLSQGTDYTVTYANNTNIGTATVTIRPGTNSNYVGIATTTFNIGNNVGTFIVTGYAPSYTYTGYAITPGVVVQSGSDTLTAGTDYTVSYANNVNAGTATITIEGTGKYSGSQTVNFVIEAKSIAACDTTDISDRTYTGDAYTPTVTVSDGTVTLTNGVDYTVTYSNNTNPGVASIVITGMGNNYTGTKIISFRIAGVAISGLKASSIKYSSLKLSWTKQGYADGYQICNSKSKVVKNVKKNSTTITGLTAGKTYKYKVRSYINNADGSKSYGAFSEVVSATTKLKTPSVTITSKKSGQAKIKWSKVSGADGYQIYYKTSAKASYKKLKTINNANVRICTVKGLESGDRCYFRVRAFKKNGSKKIYSAFNPLKVITIK